MSQPRHGPHSPQPKVGGPALPGAASRSPWPDRLSQAAIALLGLPALAMMTMGQGWERWGVLCGVAGQPFWVWATWRRRQWGMFMLSLAYLVVWGWGVWMQWA